METKAGAAPAPLLHPSSGGSVAMFMPTYGILGPTTHGS